MLLLVGTAGSMGPKVEAGCEFVCRTGGIAAIGALNDAAALLHGDAGTTITTGIDGIEWKNEDAGRHRQMR